ncbi:FAD-dependent oxidoreductase [Corallococcus exiguus]|uniref:FAD-dependent oxidoreductase n=1 Tax=Corallococcus exiguus TaxID=83462 RepID=UPI001A8F30FF|nr:FAD-dependent oxidoreductase [Corallococcus exiguus]MBN8465713.1 FAD-dependent oxidoreductase [Corallococcus exiguus]
MHAPSSQVHPLPVLIVGGGLVGLSTALFLAHQGVRSRVIEKHAGTSLHPRARGFHARTVELLRSTCAREEVDAWLGKLEKFLQNNVRLIAEHNEERLEVIPAFRKGVGTSYGEADKNLNIDKRAELAAAAAQQAAKDPDCGAVRGVAGEGAGAVEAGGPESEGQVGPAQEVAPEPAGPQTAAERFPDLSLMPGLEVEFEDARSQEFMHCWCSGMLRALKEGPLLALAPSAEVYRFTWIPSSSASSTEALSIPCT